MHKTITILTTVFLASCTFAADTISNTDAAGEEQQPPSIQAVVINTDAASKPYSPMIFGGFLEHFGRQVYGGVYEPGSPLADKQGFRTDVIEALKELKVPVIRWPGGCFVDRYHWQKGVGKNRQPYGDPRWGVIESNTFGTHEFVELCRRLGAEPYICHNSFSSVQEMVDWVAYCNATEGKFAGLRRQTATPSPSTSSSGASGTSATTSRISIGFVTAQRP